MQANGNLTIPRSKLQLHCINLTLLVTFIQQSALALINYSYESVVSHLNNEYHLHNYYRGIKIRRVRSF